MRSPPALPLALALAASAAGCASVDRSWRRDAFGPGRTMAVVSIAYDPRLLPMRDRDQVPYRRDDANTLRGTADRIFEDTRPRVLAAIARTGLFSLLPEDRVLPALGSAGFTAHPPHLEVAQGYLPPRPPRELSAIARELGVDLVINVGMYFGAEMTALDYGLDAAGTVHAETVLSVAAVDHEGRIVWRDVVSGRSRDGFWSRRSTLDGERLFAPLQEAAAEATARLVSRLREHVER